jgi:hypothetical protein
MFEIAPIVDQVLENCDISDAAHAGLYTVCGLALRLRDLYKWQKGLAPWEERDSTEILDWIEQKENTWNDLGDREFMPLSILGNTYDPFDTIGINAVLEPRGLLYGAGYGRSLKPTFFLAYVEDKREINGHPVYFLGHELARDLFTMPALHQDNSVVLRKESARLFLWDQITYIRESGRFALKYGMELCGLQYDNLKALQQDLTKVFAVYEEIYIYHETGEMHDVVFDRQTWREVIGGYPHTPVELLARAVKDLLADTNEFGTLRHIIRERNTVSLAFYVAFFHGLPKELFPELIDAFRKFVSTSDWQIVEEAVSRGHGIAKAHAEKIMEIYQTGKRRGTKEWAKEQIEKRLLGRIPGQESRSVQAGT